MFLLWEEIKDMWINDKSFVGLVVFFIAAIIGALWALMIFL